MTVNPRKLFAGRYRLPVLALLAPVLACLILMPARGHLANTSAALILVVVVVAVAAAGNRIAGAIAAISAGISFDFFLTRPYERLTIASWADVETTTLLLIVGLAVAEIAHWGYRQRTIATQRAAYLGGIQAAAKLAATGTRSPSALIHTVGEQISTVLSLQRCRFDYRTGLDFPRLLASGQIRWRNQTWDVDSDGLPGDKDTELLVESGGRFMGRYLLTPTPGTHPTRAERLVAIALAAQVGAGLRT